MTDKLNSLEKPGAPGSPGKPEESPDTPKKDQGTPELRDYRVYVCDDEKCRAKGKPFKSHHETVKAESKEAAIAKVKGAYRARKIDG